MSHLVLEQISKGFHGIPAVQTLSLMVQSGEIVALLGPSGCGKSTTLQVIAGVLQPDQGTITLQGRCLNQIPPERREIALVLQRGLLFPHLSVGENVAFGLKMRGESRALRDEKALAMLKRVQLAGFADRNPTALSGGQAQRVALARALVIHPQVLLLDEPLSALDANLREEMQDLLLTLQAQTRVTTLIVTHDQTEATMMAQRIALMFEGQLHQLGSPADFYQRPISTTAARFFGGVNFFTARGSHTRLELEGGVVLTNGIPVEGNVQVTIRPEQIQIFSEYPPLVNVLPATVTVSRFTGTQCRLNLQTHMIGALQAWLSPTQTFAVGQRVWAYLPPEALWCFTDLGSVPSLPSLSIRG